MMYLELLANAVTSNQIRSNVFASKPLLYRGGIVHVLNEKVQSRIHHFAVRLEFGVLGQIIQRNIGKFGEKLLRIGMDLEQPVIQRNTFIK